jgi:hypothetical protein
MHRQNIVLTLAVGLLPSLIYLMITVVFAVIYVIVSVLAILVTAVRVLGHASADNSMDDLFRWITNIPIAFLTLTPLKERSSRATGRTTAEPPLPKGPPGAARKEDTPVYWEAFLEMASRPGGAKDVVQSDGPVTQPIHVNIRPRHARPEQRVDADLMRV